MTVRVRGRRSAARGRDAPPHRHPPAPRGAARDAGHARQAGGQPGGAGPPALRLQPLRRAWARASCAHIREPRQRARSCATRRVHDAGDGPRGGARRRARSPSSATSTASACAWSRSRASPRSSAAARTCARPARSGSSWSPHEQGISAGHAPRRGPHRRGGASTRAQEDQGILEELEQAAKIDRREPGRRVREDARAAQGAASARSRRCKMKLATGGRSGRGRRPRRGRRTSRSGRPGFEGLDRKAHAAVVDDFRNQQQGPAVRPGVGVGRRRRACT